jgi:predicted anti-sigma-YlaC factor YlaD
VSADSRLLRERCAQQRQRISLRVDGELRRRERLLLQAHLVRCRGCRAFDGEVVRLAGALRSSALARPPAVARRRRIQAQPQRLALAAGVAVLGLTISMSGLLRGTAVAEVGALSPVQGLPVYSTPYRLEGLPVYTKPAALPPTLTS